VGGRGGAVWCSSSTNQQMQLSPCSIRPNRPVQRNPTTPTPPPQVSKDEYYRMVERKRQDALPGGESDAESAEPKRSLKEKYDQF